ncbi:MAG TPA: hypothetical protein VHD56_17255 [Tepidisphaeraceae bacterium]|nr:hypothetical protein [Tepidisphaeraceae bacterium]
MKNPMLLLLVQVLIFAVAGCASKDDLVEVDHRLTGSLHDLDKQGLQHSQDIARIQGELHVLKPTTTTSQPVSVQVEFPPESLRDIKSAIEGTGTAIQAISKSIDNSNPNTGLGSITTAIANANLPTLENLRNLNRKMDDAVAARAAMGERLAKLEEHVTGMDAQAGKNRPPYPDMAEKIGSLANRVEELEKKLEPDTVFGLKSVGWSAISASIAMLALIASSTLSLLVFLMGFWERRRQQLAVLWKELKAANHIIPTSAGFNPKDAVDAHNALELAGAMVVNGTVNRADARKMCRGIVITIADELDRAKAAGLHTFIRSEAATQLVSKWR